MLSGCIKGTASATNQMKHGCFIMVVLAVSLCKPIKQLITLDSVARNQIHPLNIVITPLVEMYLI